MYAGSAAFHKAQVDKIDGNWKTVKQNIALIAVKRYLSNILTDHEKQKAFTLFLGEFKPDSQFPGKNLWDEDAELQYKAPKGDISGDKPALFPLITRRQKLLQFNYKKYDETTAFTDENVKIITEDEEMVMYKSDKKPVKGKPRIKTEQEMEENPRAVDSPHAIIDTDKLNFLPSHYNYVGRFKKLEENFDKDFLGFIDS